MDRKQVEKVALLARLKLSEEEIEDITPQLTQILDYIDNLKDLDTSDAKAMGQPFIDALRMEEDSAEDFPDKDGLTEIAPDFSEGYYRVKKIIE